MEAEHLVIKRLLALLVLVALATGCGHPLLPRSALAMPQVAASRSGTQTAVIGANGPALGVNLYALSNYSAARVKADGMRTLSYIRNVLHAGAVDIVWNFYASSPDANTVDATSASLSAVNVAILTGIAKQDHLLVDYRPLIMIKGDHPWEGYISPADPALWFSNYYDEELPYLRMAQKYRINEFVAATEMRALNSSPYWPMFFTRIGAVYHGVISYAAHQSDYFPSGTQLLRLDYIGVDMYASLNLPSSASSAQVTAAYESSFSHVPASVLRRTAIDETGIQARVGAYQEPSYLYVPGTLDEAVQANWFIAACDTVKKYDMRAVFFWKVDLTDYPVTHPASSLSTFEGKEGARAISRCASILGG
ncbi:MAG: hypothetical protein ABSA53_06245 [Streptosporangiaceae bacterium]|jgi:hypothetical protein